MNDIGYVIIGIINLIIICWFIAKINSVDVSLRSIAKNLEILTQNQKVFISEQLIKDKNLKESEQVKSLDEEARIDKNDILNKMRNKL